MSSEIRKREFAEHPLSQLPREDLDLVVELVLRSGSLKELADAYGVSYPTIRLRLNRLIERLQAVMKGRPVDPVTDLLAQLVARGELSAAGARSIRELVRQSKQTVRVESPKSQEDS
jgi:hypothetical protein